MRCAQLIPTWSHLGASSCDGLRYDGQPWRHGTEVEVPTGQVTPLALVLSFAVAHDNGISGYSSKQGVICNQCHGGGTAPTVALTGPSTLTPGESAQYTFTITGGAAARGGFNVAQ